MPTISVIMPCYNYGKLLPDAVHSLVGGPTCLGEFEPQTYQDFDIWIINDASTDDTDAVAHGLVSDRVHYIRNDVNLGTAATLNVAIRQSGGRVITYLSADDMMETTRLERLYRALMDSQHRFVYDDLRVFDGTQRTETWPMADYDFDRCLYKNIVHAGIMYPRRAWEEIGGYPEILRDGREDWGVNVALGRIGWCGVHIREPLYLYRRAGQNRSLNNQGNEWRQTFLGRMQQLFPDLYRGERPPMCCGNSKKSVPAPSKRGGTNAAAQRATAMFEIGSDGMVLLEYQLPKAGHVVYTGSVTKQQYIFSSLRKRGYVDSRDAPALLARIEDRRHAFVAVAPPVKPVTVTPPYEQIAPAPAPVVDAKAAEEIIITETVPQADTPKPRKPRKS